jgi:hypothetical protein
MCIRDSFKGITNYLEEIESYANENSISFDVAVSELMDYGVILWDEIVSMVLDVLHIDDRQVILDDLMFDHIDSSIILVLARTEDSEGVVDEITLDLSCEGMSLYAIHYLRDNEEWKLKDLPEGFEPVFDRDEKAVILKTRGKTLEDLPTLGTLENLMNELIIRH